MKRMPDRPETWAFLSVWLEHNWPGVDAAILAGMSAGLRVVYGGGNLRRVLLEASLCGLLALAVSHGIGRVGIPSESAPFFGGAIGLLGVEGTRAAARRFFNRKVDTL